MDITLFLQKIFSFLRYVFCLEFIGNKPVSDTSFDEDSKDVESKTQVQEAEATVEAEAKVQKADTVEVYETYITSCNLTSYCNVACFLDNFVSFDECRETLRDVWTRSINFLMLLKGEFGDKIPMQLLDTSEAGTILMLHVVIKTYFGDDNIDSLTSVHNSLVRNKLNPLVREHKLENCVRTLIIRYNNEDDDWESLYNDLTKVQ